MARTRARARAGPPPSWLRWLVRFRCPLTAALDDSLAAGADPWSGRGLMARADHLCSRRHRIRMAKALEALVTISEFPKMSSRGLRLDIAAVCEQRPHLEALAEHLRAPSPIDVAVLARLTNLLWRRESPLYMGGTRSTDLAAALAGCASPMLRPRMR